MVAKGKQKSVALLYRGFRNWMNSQPQINKCRHFETKQESKKLPRQIYSKLPKVPFKHFNSKKNIIKFYT